MDKDNEDGESIAKPRKWSYEGPGEKKEQRMGKWPRWVLPGPLSTCSLWAGGGLAHGHARARASLELD